MKKLSVSLSEKHVKAIDERQNNGDARSRSEALRQILDEYDRVRRECEVVRDECEELRDECDDLRDQLVEEIETADKHRREAERLEAANEDLRDHVDHLKTELEQRDALLEDLRSQLQVANSKNDRIDTLAEYAEDERTNAERWRQAGLWTRAKWKVFGMPTDETSA